MTRSSNPKKKIKDALLNLLETKPYNQISITELCSRAKISRGTFYRYYENMKEPLDELINDALQLLYRNDDQYQKDFEILSEIAKSGDQKKIIENYTSLPICQRVNQLPGYKVLFNDESISAYVIRILYELEKKQYIPLIMSNYHFSYDEADTLFRYIMYGAYYTNKNSGWDDTEQWCSAQLLIIRLLFNGFRHLQ